MHPGVGMPEQLDTILSETTLRAALRAAWLDSWPGTVEAHEEGGFLIKDSTGSLNAIRWRRGQQNSIILPSHPGCKIGGSDIILTFHTHPNPGPNYIQEPSQTDIRAVRDDADLKGAFYLGEIVISKETLYLIDPTGQVVVVGSPDLFLADG
jgi:hypothetical protein